MHIAQDTQHTHTHTPSPKHVKNTKSSPNHKVPPGGTDLHFLSPRTYITIHCEIMDTGLVHRTTCPFMFQVIIGTQYSLCLHTEGWPWYAVWYDMPV